MTERILLRILLRAIATRRAWQRLAELTGRLEYADYAADLDAPIVRLWSRYRRGR